MTDRPDDTTTPEEPDRRSATRAELHTDDLRGRRPDDPRALDATGADEGTERAAPLVGDADDLRRRWERIQAGFVDEPRRAVEQADSLVAEVIQDLVDTFSSERRRLEDQWSGGGEVSTEDLRISLQRYRSFFQRLLHT